MSRKFTPYAVAIVSALLLVTSAGTQAQAAVVDQYGAKVNQLIDGMYPQLEEVYKDIHAHPELGFQKTRTAAKLASEMNALGFRRDGDRHGGLPSHLARGRVRS